MCGSWQKIVVDQRKAHFEASETVFAHFCLFAQTTFSTLLMLKCMWTCSLGCRLKDRVEKVVLRRTVSLASKCAYTRTARSLDSLHPNEQVYMHFNIKRVEKVVLRRKKAKMGKTHCFTCFKMRLHLR